jgi:hypothetical protein
MLIPKSTYRQSFSAFFVVSFIAIGVLRWTNVFANAGINGGVVLGADVIIYFATAFSFWFSVRALKSPNPNASVRSLYGSFMIKFFVIIMAAFIYIMVEKKNVNKPALYISMGLYIIYTFLEVSSLQKLLKQKKNA